MADLRADGLGQEVESSAAGAKDGVDPALPKLLPRPAEELRRGSVGGQVPADLLGVGERKGHSLQGPPGDLERIAGCVRGLVPEADVRDQVAVRVRAEQAVAEADVAP